MVHSQGQQGRDVTSSRVGEQSKGQKEGDIKRKGEGERDDNSTKHWCVRSVKRVDRELLLIAMKASGRLGLMGGCETERDRQHPG